MSKYSEFILERNVNKRKPLFISASSKNTSIAIDLAETAHSNGIKDVYINFYDQLDAKEAWIEYANNNSNFIIFVGEDFDSTFASMISHDLPKIDIYPSYYKVEVENLEDEIRNSNVEKIDRKIKYLKNLKLRCLTIFEPARVDIELPVDNIVYNNQIFPSKGFEYLTTTSDITGYIEPAGDSYLAGKRLEDFRIDINRGNIDFDSKTYVPELKEFFKFNNEPRIASVSIKERLSLFPEEDNYIDRLNNSPYIKLVNNDGDVIYMPLCSSNLRIKGYTMEGNSHSIISESKIKMKDRF